MGNETLPWNAPNRELVKAGVIINSGITDAKKYIMSFSGCQARFAYVFKKYSKKIGL